MKRKIGGKKVSAATASGGLVGLILTARGAWGRMLDAERRWAGRNSKVLGRAGITFTVVFFAVWTAYRIDRLGADKNLRINNIVRIHTETGIPQSTVVAEQTSEFLLEAVHVTNGRALVSGSRIGRFRVGQGVLGENSRVTMVSNRVDIDSGMYIVRFSGNISGTVMVMRRYTGFFLPLEAELPDGARVIARDAKRQVVLGLTPGQEIVVR